MGFQATSDLVILKLDHSEKTTESGLVIAERGDKPPKHGTVVSVGPGAYDSFGQLIPMPVKVGDEVVFAHSSAYGIEVEGEKYVTVPLSGILAIMAED